VWYRTVAEFLQLPPELMLFSGMALGYRDESAPINALKTDRAPLEEFAELRGF
jgi:nitroreductase